MQNIADYCAKKWDKYTDYLWIFEEKGRKFGGVRGIVYLCDKNDRIGITDLQIYGYTDLKKLVNQGVLTRYKRPKGYIYHVKSK